MAQTEYMANYEKENLRQIRLKINRKTEPDMLAWVEKQENVQGYIKQLIRREMPQKAELRNQTWFCQKCKNPVEMFNAGEFNNYCPFCGQKLIWN